MPSVRFLWPVVSVRPSACQQVRSPQPSNDLDQIWKDGYLVSRDATVLTLSQNNLVIIATDFMALVLEGSITAFDFTFFVYQVFSCWLKKV